MNRRHCTTLRQNAKKILNAWNELKDLLQTKHLVDLEAKNELVFEHQERDFSWKQAQGVRVPSCRFRVSGNQRQETTELRIVG